MDQFTLQTILLPKIEVNGKFIYKKKWTYKQTLKVIEEENVRWTYFKVETSLDYPGVPNTLWSEPNEL